MNHYFSEHNEKKAKHLKKYMGLVRKENYEKRQEDYAFEKAVREDRKKEPFKKTELKESSDDRIYINHLHKSVSRKDLTEELMEKECEFGENNRDRI